jgi:hypothetical protein
MADPLLAERNAKEEAPSQEYKISSKSKALEDVRS